MAGSQATHRHLPHRRRTSFVSDDAAAAIDHARNTYATAKQDIHRRALARSKEINEQRAQLAKQVVRGTVTRTQLVARRGPRLRSLQQRQDDQSRPSYVHRFHGAVSRRDGRARQQSGRHARQTIEGWFSRHASHLFLIAAAADRRIDAAWQEAVPLEVYKALTSNMPAVAMFGFASATRRQRVRAPHS
jgi:hypothetical protein